MNKQNRIVVACIFCMLALIFIIFPVGASNLHLKITFGTESKDKTVPDDFYLYYSIDGSDFSEENMVKGSLDEKKNEITFTLDSSYENKITLLRVDFPSQNDILKVESVSVSSGGLNKKIYTADEFR